MNHAFAAVTTQVRANGYGEKKTFSAGSAAAVPRRRSHCAAAA